MIRGLGVLAACAFVALAGAYLLDRYPPHVSFLDETAGVEVRGALEMDPTPGDVLVVLDPAAIARAAAAGSFARNDWSAAWLNLVHREVGHAAVCAPAGLELALASPRRLVIVTHSANQALAAAQVAALETLARGGATVVRELPPAGLATSVAALRALPDLSERERSAMARLQYLEPSGGPAPEAVAVGAPPIIAERAIGSGRIVEVHLDVGHLLVASQQGVPCTDDYQVRQRHGDYDDILEPDDLVQDAALRDNLVPHVDVFMHWLFERIRPPAMPVIGRAPVGATGVFVMTHDEDFRGDRECKAIVDATRAAGGKSTVLVIPHPRLADLWSAASAKALADRGVDIGLHWNQYPMPRGIKSFEPFRKVFSIASQKAMLAPILAQPLVSNRNHYLIWTQDYARAFRLMAAQGIAIDSTYGANKGKGYLFGTGSPFLPMDENGLPLSLLEVPFLNQETWGGAGSAFFDQILRDNAALVHGSYVAIFHPHLDFKAAAIEGHPGGEFFASVVGKARDLGYSFMTLAELSAFERSRWTATIESRQTEHGGKAEVTCSQPLALYIPLADRTSAPTVLMNGGEVHGFLVHVGRESYLAVSASGQVEWTFR